MSRMDFTASLKVMLVGMIAQISYLSKFFWIDTPVHIHYIRGETEQWEISNLYITFYNV